MCCGKGVRPPNVQAISGETIYIATDSTEEYIAMVPYGVFEIYTGSPDDLWKFNYALSAAESDEADCSDFYALIIPDCSLLIADQRLGQPAVAEVLPKQKAGRKLEFL